MDVPSVSAELLFRFSSFLKQSVRLTVPEWLMQRLMSPSALMESLSSKSQNNCCIIPRWSRLARVCGATRQKGAADVDADGKRHRLPFCHQRSGACPSTLAAVKRSERCSDILYTSRARTPAADLPPSHGNVTATEMRAGRGGSVWQQQQQQQ